MAEQQKDPEPIGWDAITAACEKIYGSVEPNHYAPQVPAMLGGQDPLNGISIYANSTPAHWHYVTYGFSELYEKESTDPSISGFGFELTFRLARAAADAQPPPWPLNLLQNLARYVFKSGKWFEPGHKLTCNGKMAADKETDLTAMLFVSDAQMGVIETPNGRVQFVQIVGITTDEYELTMEWSTDGLASMLALDNPLNVTTLDRSSILNDPERAAQIRQRVAKEGSNQGVTFSSQLSWRATSDRAMVVIGANYIESVVRVLNARLPHGRNFIIQGNDQRVYFVPGAASEWRTEGGTIAITTPPDALKQLCAGLKPLRGAYHFPALPRVTFEVVPTELKDGYGEKVIQVIG